MAITSARMQIKRGNEVDFDAEKMLVGEWALSTDKRIVRICVAPNVCIRMATYDAFEVDMAQIEKILEECQTIEDVVKLINSQVSEKLELTIEYTNQAKQYRDEAEQFRNEAEAFAPDGYDELKETVASNTFKIDTIIEKAELNIKNSASGENIHLTDSANGKAVEFGLYGKATQDGEPTPDNPIEITVAGEGYNLLENTAESTISNGVTFTVNDDGSVTASGTASANAVIYIRPELLPIGKYILNGCPQGGSTTTYRLEIGVLKSTGNVYVYDSGNGVEFEIDSDTTSILIYPLVTNGQTVNNLTFKPMIRKAYVKNNRYMPYGKGSVEVVSCGKNLYHEVTNNKSYSYSGIILEKDNDNGHLTISGTSTASVNMVMNTFTLPAGTYCFSKGNVTGASVNLYNKTTSAFIVRGSGSFTLDKNSELDVRVQVGSGSTASGTFWIQIEKGTVATEYEPYTETLSTIPTPNGLAGIKVSSGGNYTDENGQQWITDEIVKYADGSGKRVQRVGKAVLNGTESWGVSGSRFSAKIASGNTVNAICTHAIKRTVAEMTNFGNGFYLYTSGYMDFMNDSYTTVAEFKAWLSSNNVTVIYELAEPIITDLSAEEIAEIEKLHTFYPITNISNDADCGMSITYMADAKNYIDNRLALIESAMLNNI